MTPGGRIGLVAALVLAVSCGPPPAAPVKFLIGVSQANLSEPWRITMTDEIQRQAAVHPELRVIVTDASDSLGKQIGDVEKFEGLGVDLLIISPLESEALTPTVTRVYQKIPVIVLNRSVANYDYTLFIGPDNARIGREAGRTVADLLKATGGEVLEVLGRSGSPPTLERAEGFRQEIARNPRIHLQTPVLANWLRDGAEDLVLDRLKADGPPRVVFAHNDAMAYGAWRAADQLHLTDRIAFLGVDGLPGPQGGLELLRSGILSATFVSPTGGKEAVEYALALLNHRGEQPKKVILGARLLTKTDVDRPPLQGLLADRSLTIGVRWSSGAGVARDRLRKSVTEALGLRPWTVRVLSSADNGGWEGIDAVVLDADDARPEDTAARLSLEVQARARGLPIVWLGPQPGGDDEGPWTLVLGPDPAEEGLRAGRWLADAGRRRIVEIAGPGVEAGQGARSAGLAAGLRDRGGALVTARLVTDGSTEGVRAALVQARAAGLPFDGVFVTGDEATQGVLRALGDGVSSVSVVAVGDGPALASDLREGRIAALVRRPSDLGAMLRTHLAQALAEPGVSRRLVTSHDVLTR